MRSKRLSLVRLRGVLGDSYPVVGILKRLKCSTCGIKQITASFLASHQAGTSLQHWFQWPAE